MVDHQGQFTHIYVGWLGRVHDAQVFSISSLYQKGQNNTLFPDLKEQIAGREIALVILGDPVYPLLPWLMNAFPDNSRLSHQHKTLTYVELE